MAYGVCCGINGWRHSLSSAAGQCVSWLSGQWRINGNRGEISQLAAGVYKSRHKALNGIPASAQSRVAAGNGALAAAARGASSLAAAAPPAAAWLAYAAAAFGWAAQSA